VLDAAVDAFWEHGYGETSAQLLTECTGLSRSSLYGTFSSKRELFLAALDRYREQSSWIEALQGDEPIRDRIRTVLEFAVPGAPGCDPRGCLIVNTALELAGRDDEVQTRVRMDFERGSAALRAAFVRAIAAGELSADRDPDALAGQVQATANGLRVLGAAAAPRAQLEAIVDATVAAL
jgi:TetR/AcrR family transcriptional regulator, transcriptional repressor for nem operon